LDETTGELIFVSIAKSDTIFIDSNLYSNKQYFYRVYQMNDLGRLGGSNIVSVSTILENFIPDGGFEETDNLDKYWISTKGFDQNVLEITDSIKYSGNSSLHASFSGTSPNPNIVLENILNVEPNSQYEVSFYMKVHGLRQNTDDMFLHLKQGNEYIPIYFDVPIILPSGMVDSDWTKYSKRITTLNSNQLEVSILFWNENVWIDDLVIKPYE